MLFRLPVRLRLGDLFEGTGQDAPRERVPLGVPMPIVGEVVTHGIASRRHGLAQVHNRHTGVDSYAHAKHNIDAYSSLTAQPYWVKGASRIATTDNPLPHWLSTALQPQHVILARVRPSYQGIARGHHLVDGALLLAAIPQARTSLGQMKTGSSALFVKVPG